jgi:drug/metabolite transporter (DMT)-like permease
MTSSRRPSGGGSGLLFALLAASTFGLSGIFATALTDAGWTPAAAVTVRVTVAALVLTIPALIQVRRRWVSLRAGGGLALRRSAGAVVIYGLVAVAACQVAFFNAVQRLDVGVALLLEYLGVVLVVLYMWLRHGQRPRRLTLVGSGAAIVGLLLVLNLTSSHRLDPVGVLWALGAAVGLAVFYVISARADEHLPPVTLAWAAMVVGGAALIGLGWLGALPVHANLRAVRLADHTVSWIVPVLGLAILAGAVAYTAAIGAARRLGARLASLAGLTEVLFAVLFAWLLLGQVPSALQLCGGLLIVAGIAIVRIDELRRPADEPLPRLPELDD